MMDRRDFFSKATAAAATVVIPAVSSAQSDVPDSWKKLVSDVAQSATPHLGAGERYTVVSKPRLDALINASGAAVEAKAKDPHPKWIEEWYELKDRFNAEYPEPGTPLDQAFWAKEDEIMNTPATTAEGVLAQLEFLLHEEIGLDSEFEGHVTLIKNMRATLKDLAG